MVKILIWDTGGQYIYEIDENSPFYVHEEQEEEE